MPMKNYFSINIQKNAQINILKDLLRLTPKEKKYIDKKDKESDTKSYSYALKHKHNNKNSYYICPQYFCLSDEKDIPRSLSIKQINEGACGGWENVIDPFSKKIKNSNEVIVNFTDMRYHLNEQFQTKNDKGKSVFDDNYRGEMFFSYKPMYPGFMKSSKHPQNKHMPCCFGKPSIDINKKDYNKFIEHMFEPSEKNPVKYDGKKINYKDKKFVHRW